MIASVLDDVIRPAATLVIWRSAPALPTLTTLDGVAPAKLPYVVEPMVALLVGFAAAVTEPLPSATSPALFAMAFGPIATELVPRAWLSGAVEFA
ncbi:Tash protein PEST motif family, partial [Burkholderia ubonensis]